MRNLSSLFRIAVVAVLLPFLFTPLSAQDVGVRAITKPSATICGGNFLPEVVVENAGPQEITSLRLNYVLDGVLIANFSWLGSLLQGQTDTISFPALNLALGLYTIQVYTSDPNFSPDTNPLNDTLQRTFEVTTSTGQSAPYIEDFSDQGFPYPGYIVNNPDAALSWQRTDLVSLSGDGCLMMNNYNYPAIGQEDEITLPGINVSTLDKSALSFYVAHAQYGVNSGFADTLEVYVSGDCGETFERVYRKWGAELATVVPTTTEFFPKGSWAWRKEWVDLSNYQNSTFLVVRFRHVNNYENNLFIDLVQVERIFALSTTADVTQSMKISALAAPNDLSIEVGLEIPPSHRSAVLTMYDIQGRELYRSATLFSGQHQLEIPAAPLPSGAYYLRSESEMGGRVSKTLIWR